MLKDVYESPLSYLLGKIDTFLATYLSSKYWIWHVVATCLVLSVVHMIASNPSVLWAYSQFWRSLWKGDEFDAYVTLKKQAATFYQDGGFSHFTHSHYNSDGHLHKMRFRLFLPFLVATFHIERVGLTIVILQLLLSLVFLWLATTLTQRLLHDRICTFLFMLSFSLSYPVRAAWLDITAYGDFFAYFFLLLALWTNRPVVIFMCLQLAFWTDERALLNAVYVLLWHGFHAYFEQKKYTITQAQFAVVLSGFTYLLLRHYLSQLVHFPLVDESYWAEFLSTYYENIKVIGFRFWSGFSSYWFLILLSLVLLIYERNYTIALLFAGALFLTLNVSFIVYDVNRAMSYGYGAIFIAIALLRHSLNVVEIRRLLLFIFVHMLLFPLHNRLRLPGGYTIM